MRQTTIFHRPVPAVALAPLVECKAALSWRGRGLSVAPPRHCSTWALGEELVVSSPSAIVTVPVVVTDPMAVAAVSEKPSSQLSSANAGYYCTWFGREPAHGRLSRPAPVVTPLWHYRPAELLPPERPFGWFTCSLRCRYCASHSDGI
jgi:hypothetical protein